jgi:hypothetical protein
MIAMLWLLFLNKPLKYNFKNVIAKNAAIQMLFIVNAAETEA